MSKMRAIALALVVLGLVPPASASAASPTIFGPCPNEVFRPDEETALNLGLDGVGANLPECRAYEQATPVNKNGGDVTATVPYAKATANGDGVTFISKSGIPGGVGAQEFPSYLASRRSGWETHGLLPPATEGQAALLLGWTPDFSEVFTKATRFGSPSETEILARPGTGGVPVKVIDYTVGLEPQFVGTTEDGSLLFESPAKLLEGAAPGRPNVYLWERASGKVSLVGALNDGSAPGQGAIAGPYDWVHGTNAATLSEGGGTRKYYTEQENVIARDDSAAFFTAAGSGKLYERLNPGASQSPMKEGKCTEEATKACTLELSASEKTNGTGPGGIELGGPRPAAFQAASADGKVVYFTSQEELTNGANTGPEPSELPPQPFIASAKVDSGTAEDFNLKFALARASGLTTDSTYLYWADSEAGTIGRAKLDGTEVNPVFISGLVGIEDLTVDAGHIYWTMPSAGTIGRADISGNPASVKANFISGAKGPKGVAVGGELLYWTNSAGESLGRANVNGSEVNEDFIKFEEAGAKVPTQGLAVDPAGGHIYVALKGVFIQSYDLDGKKVAKIEVSELAGDVDLALDGTHLYWNYEETSGESIPELHESLISRAKLDLSDKEEKFIKEGKGVERAQSVTTAGGHVYWANDPPLALKPGNELYRYQASSGTLEDVSAGSGAENGAEVQGVLGTSRDGSVVYFAANGDLDGPGGGKAGDCTGRLGSASGECSLYRWEVGGKASFVARLDAGGNEIETDAANWAATPYKISGFTSVNFQKTAQVSEDGEALLFRSQRQLGAYPNEGAAEFYLYRNGTGLACVSCDPSGASPVGTPDLGDIYPGTSTIPLAISSFASRNLTAGGKRVFFETPDALVNADTNGEPSCPLTEGQFAHRACLDVYEWEAVGTGSCVAGEATVEGGCIYLLSTGKGKEPAILADASESGEDVFFFSRDRLVGQDKDELVDVYDVRANGGLGAQNPPAPPPACESVEACHEAPPAPPAPALAPVTPGFFGPGNAKPAKKAHKGKKHHKKGHRKGKAKAKQGARR